MPELIIKGVEGLKLVSDEELLIGTVKFQCRIKAINCNFFLKCRPALRLSTYIIYITCIHGRTSEVDQMEEGSILIHGLLHKFMGGSLLGHIR